MDWVIAVGSVNKDYGKSYFSNWGPLVSSLAPGFDIRSAGIKNDYDFTEMRGTSMASPFVAGTMAIFVGFEGINDDVAKVYSRLNRNQILDAATGFSPDTPNRLVTTGIHNPSKTQEQPYLDAPNDPLFNANDAKPKAAALPMTFTTTFREYQIEYLQTRSDR